MEDIHTIYYNSFGIAFQWKRCAAKDFNKIQIVFKNTGLYLNYQELILFSKCIANALIQSSQCHCCNDIKPCKSILLQTPFSVVSFAINKVELKAIQDLINGTLFHLNFDKTLSEILSK